MTPIPFRRGVWVWASLVLCLLLAVVFFLADVLARWNTVAQISAVTFSDAPLASFTARTGSLVVELDEGAPEVAADLVAARRAGQTPPPHLSGLPGLEDGVDGLRFITAAVRSAAADGAWVPLKEASE